ncbi:MAG: diguanylate cyclase domain-containing protein [Acidimicrobiales bacterium]
MDEPNEQARAIDSEVLAQLLDSLPDWVMVTDSQARVLWANRATLLMFERSRTDSVGMSGLDFVHPEDLELVLRSLVTVQSKEVGVPIEIRVSTPIGWRLAEIVGTPVPWVEPGAVLFTVRDLTDRRRFELARNREARLRSLVHSAAAVTMLVTPEGVVESASGALSRVLGHDPELVEGHPLADLVSEEDRPALAQALLSATAGASTTNPVSVRLAMVRQSGLKPIPFELTLVNLTDDPTIGGFVITGHDVTAQASIELELRKTLSLLTATLNSTADGILVVDDSGAITSFNQRFVEMWHLPDSIIDTLDSATGLAYVTDQLVRPDEFLAKVGEVYAHPEAESHDILEFKDNRVFERYSIAQQVDGSVVGRVWSFRDVTDRKRLENELSFQAFHDSLTGLANKALFQDCLQRATARLERTENHLAVLFLDLDDFKTVNDSLGHLAGDQLLKVAAEILLGCLRRVDTAARLGGDEFAVLAEDLARPSDVIELTERILAAFREPLTIGATEVSATVSIGVAFDAPGVTSDQLLRNADLAMYAAKERGKNRYEQFEDEMRSGVIARLDTDSAGRRAPDVD